MTKRLMKLVAMVMTLVLALGLFAGCGNKANEEANGNNAATEQNATEEDTATEPATVEFWTMQLSPTFDDYINGVVEKFEAENPNITVKWVDVPWGDMEQKILAAAASGNMPDVANLNIHFAQKLAQLDVLVDMEEAAGDVKDLYFKGPWEGSSFDGKTYAIPWYLTTGVLFYNTQLFEEAGLDATAAPKNYEEVYEMSKAIKEKTGKYGFMPVFDQHLGMEELEKMGIRLFNEDFTKAEFSKPEVIEGIEFFKKMIDEGLIPREAVTVDNGEALQKFQSGEVAIFSGGTSYAGMIEKNAKEVYDVTAIAPQLTNEGGKVNVAVMNVVVPKASENVDASVKFAEFLTNAENQVEFCEIAGAILPSIKDSINADFFSKSEGDAVSEARVISAKQLEVAEVIFPPIENWDDIKTAFKEGLQKALLSEGDVDIEAAMKEAEDIANEALNK